MLNLDPSQESYGCKLPVTVRVEGEPGVGNPRGLTAMLWGVRASSVLGRD